MPYVASKTPLLNTEIKRTSKLIRHKWPVMLNIRWLNPRLYQILQTRYKYLRVAQAFKDQFRSEKTYSCKLDLKGLSHVASVFIYTPNSIPLAKPKLQNHYFHTKTRTGFYLERFPKIIIWNSHWRKNLSVKLVNFLVISEQYSYKK